MPFWCLFRILIGEVLPFKCVVVVVVLVLGLFGFLQFWLLICAAFVISLVSPYGFLGGAMTLPEVNLPEDSMFVLDPLDLKSLSSPKKIFCPNCCTNKCFFENGHSN